MTALSLDIALMDFDAFAAGALDTVAGESDEPARAHPPIETTTPGSTEGSIEQTRAAASSAALAAFRSELASSHAAHAAAMAAERLRWCSAQAELLAQSVMNGLDAIEHSFADQIARLIRPLIAASIQDKIISELQTAIQQKLQLAPGTTIRASGPADLISFLSSLPVLRDARTILEVQEVPSLTLIMDETELVIDVAALTKLAGQDGRS